MIVEAVAAALICLDPGHGTPRRSDAQTEPIGPGSSVLQDQGRRRRAGRGGGRAGDRQEDAHAPPRPGYRVAMTRTGPVFDYGTGGNVARAQFCNRRHAALMLRIHADGSTSSSQHGMATLYPSLHRGWTDDIYTRSLRAARLVQRTTAATTGARDNGLVGRSDLTGFNWANVPAILVETGFMTNPLERSRLQSGAYQWKVARGFTAGIWAFTKP